MSIRIVGCLAFLGMMLTHAQAQVRAGDTAPPITLESLSNNPDKLKSVSWEHFGDRVVLLEFWGTWCGPCVAAIPHLNEIASELEESDSVAFLSVTFEDTDVIDPFLKKQPMRSLIGHDTDRSMPEAFGVRSWPTTFIVKNGIILYRGYPGAVSAELLDALTPADADPVTLSQRFPMLSSRVQTPGSENPSGSAWTPATDADIHVMLGPATDDSYSGLSKGRGPSGITVSSGAISIQGIVSGVWDRPSHRIEMAPELDNDRMYRFVFKAPYSKLGSAQAFLEANLDVEIHEVQSITEGLHAAPSAKGLTLPEPIGTGSSMRTARDDKSIHITGPRMRVGDFLRVVAAQLGMPVEVPPSLDGQDFKCDIKIPINDREAAIRVIGKTLGIELKPAQLEITMLRVSPSKNG